MKAVGAAFNQEKALVGAFSVIVQPVVDPMDRFTALMERMKYCSGCGGDGDLEQEHTSGYQKMESKQNIAQCRALSRGGPMVNGMEVLFSVLLFSFFSLVCKRLHMLMIFESATNIYFTG